MPGDPISGWYVGDLTTPGGGSDRLHLRIDVDRKIELAPVTNRISADLFHVDEIKLPGQPPQQAEVYRESWLIDRPQVTQDADAVRAEGVVRFWNGIHPSTTAQIRIPIKPANAPVEVTLLHEGTPSLHFNCVKASKFFRTVNLEIDVCQSVNNPPIFPVYGTHASTRPASTPKRDLTIEAVYAEAGIDLRILRENLTVIDDFTVKSWTAAELHNVMQKHFHYMTSGGGWPAWELWGLMATQFEEPRVGGVMFDTSKQFGGAGSASERQGFAVFRKHLWFNDLVETPKTAAQAEAARKFLYTWVHEAGHAFNFLHSWDKNRPSALSWMNYDWKYDSIHGAGAFWQSFPFRFDDEELIHIRHGNRPSVIMGGDPWASGGHAEAPPGAEYLKTPPGAMASVSGALPVELLVRSQEYFDFMEPVSLELRLRNTLPDLPLTLETELDPEFGGITVYIRRPDGRIVEFSPVACKLAAQKFTTLAPARGEEGADRYSQNVFIGYGRYGFYFEEPGQYQVRAIYHGAGNVLVPSNVHRLRVGQPRDREQDRFAQDFFDSDIGLSLYLKGSPSDALRGAMDTLQELFDREPENSMTAAKTAARIAPGMARDFHDVRENEMVLTREADPGAALKLTDRAVQTLGEEPSKAFNLQLAKLMEKRADMMMTIGDPDRARKELLDLAYKLSERGANAPVVEDIRRKAETCR
ncbi:MAG TPA: hypothetical protein VGR02_04890 [Thermoanaerobaculia bacterium]|jgi:hypothetical protein|nr:hypothetical protein [Thermoanaerobaculia bacterium]